MRYRLRRGGMGIWYGWTRSEAIAWLYWRNR